ncbi:MAG: MoaD/ThiS family protein [Chloroflexi bacterium]|nr:MAG: MoaD/ThiS family protein [Chloroflexota bacterium]
MAYSRETMAVALSVQVLLFARLRELAAARSLEVAVAPGASVRDVWEAAVRRHDRLRGADAGVRVAVNEDYAAWDDPVRSGDSIAFIPPVAGGAPTAGGPGVHVLLTTDRLDPAAAASAPSPGWCATTPRAAPSSASSTRPTRRWPSPRCAASARRPCAAPARPRWRSGTAPAPWRSARRASW